MSTIIHWYRNDLRVSDLPALYDAVHRADTVVPVFVFDDTLLSGKHGSPNRNRFLIECLQDLQQSLKTCGGNLIYRHGAAQTELVSLAGELNVTRIHYTIDYTPYARRRDSKLKAELARHGIELVGYPGRLAVDSLENIHTKSNTPHKVFTPFWKNWQAIERREICPVPKNVVLPARIESGEIFDQNVLTDTHDLSPHAQKGGERSGRTKLDEFLRNTIDSYDSSQNDLAKDATSRLSPYLHFGCISVREIETMLSDSHGSRSWHRQLAWRDFYHYIMLHFPSNARTEFQERYRTLPWVHDPDALQRWKEGKTGYPIIDAAMRQLREEGWMHNRGRLIVGSFLTKDLQIDWREGEAWFMRMLIDGDQANNNGNWQWIASVGVDPAPLFRRLYNPMTQQERHDPSGAYVRKYVPELSNVPLKFLSKPWGMSEEEQKSANCIIGTTYPRPIVDHGEARLATLERYRGSAA